MKRAHGHSLLAVLLVALSFTPESLLAQSRGARNPVFIAVTFQAPQGDPGLGIEVAEAVRQRMLRTFPYPPRPGALRVVRRDEINDQLVAAAYPADSAITTNDFQMLGKSIGADESMEGTVRRTAQGVEARARIYVLSNIAAPEVLPVVVEKNAETAGRKIAEMYIQARKELPEYEKCKNALIQNQPEQAVVAARAAMAIYDKGVLPRACLLTAYSRLVDQQKMALDSIERVANEIVAIHPENEIALTELYKVHRARGDTEKAIQVSMKMFELNISNVAMAKSYIEAIADMGSPENALMMADAVAKRHPGDPSIVEIQWKLLLNTSQWKRAIAIGEEMVKIDTTKADTVFFRRQTGAALQDSQPQLALQYLSRATAKFPNDVLLLQAYAAELRKQGQVQQALEIAKKVVALDPKAELGYATIVFLYTQLGQGDSAVAFAKQALTTADSATRSQIGAGLLTLVGPSLTKAQADSTSPPDAQRANWTEVYNLSAAVDSIVPQAQTAFYMSFAAFNLAMNALNRIGPLSQARNNAGACAELKTAADMVLIVDLNMSRGGRANPQAAGNILTALSGTIKPYIDTTRQQLNCR